MQTNDVDNNHQQFKTTNKVLQSSMNKLEQTLNEVQREEQQLED